MESGQILQRSFDAFMVFERGIEYVFFFYNEIPGSPFHLAVKISCKPISYKNRQRPFHPLFLEILKGIGIVKKSLQPGLVPHKDIHGGNKADFFGVLIWTLAQQACLCPVDVT